MASESSSALEGNGHLIINNPGHTRNLRSNTIRHRVQDQAVSCPVARRHPTLPSSETKPRGLTSITTADANNRSVPPPGHQLLAKVEEAKRRGKLPKLYDSSVIRLVDGRWMVPQMCESCQEMTRDTTKSHKRPKCDRKSPCSACGVTGSECQSGGLMIALGPLKRSAQTIAGQEYVLAVAPIFSDFIPALHVVQNLDSTWDCSAQIFPSRYITEEDADTLEKTITQPQAVATPDSFLSSETEKCDGVISAGHVSDSNSSITLGTPTKPRGRKRKVSDDDFIPSTPIDNLKKQRGGHSASSDLEPALKRRATANRGVGYAKYYKSMQEDKPEPYGAPPVWADKRQNLCETLPYYKAYMSAAHLRENMVRGFMADKEVGPRDKFDDEIMITRVGGGRKLDDESGKMIQMSDQNKSIVSFGFQRAKEMMSPIALIAGQGNRISPSKMPHYYNVLGWFHVTDVWCEKSEGFKCWMVRLEKINLGEKSWWAAKDSPPLDSNRLLHAIKTTAMSCQVCNEPSKQIYNHGWTCLQTSCRAYFDFNKEIDNATLDYNEEFMKERTPFSGALPLPPLAPPPLSTTNMSDCDFGYEAAFKTGIVCPLCKGCSRRIEWRQWTCETLGCGYTYRIKQGTMKVHDAVAESLSLDRPPYRENQALRSREMIMGLYNVVEYILPGTEENEVVGVVRHFMANGVINSQAHGPNDLFRQLQEIDLGLKRYPARMKGSTAEVLTSHWAANWGAPYKYGISVLSKGFEEAPAVVIKALKRLTWAGNQTVAENLEPFHPFNELLSIGYFEESSIGYHDDGEKELGPTVATLSLGGEAMMALRPKAKSGLGRDSKNAKGTKSDVLRMVLRHGDLVVMHGSGIQKLYEHAVTPQGKLRFALTSRYVRPELMANDAERHQTILKSKLPDGHEQYDYNGDVNSQLSAMDSDSENVGAAQKTMNDLASRAITGQIDMRTMKQCHQLFTQLLRNVTVPVVGDDDTAMGDAP